MNRVDNKQQEKCVSDIFMFDEAVYKSVYPYTAAHFINQMIFRAWGKWQFVGAAILLIVTVPCLMMFLSYEDPYQPKYLLLLLPLVLEVLLVALGIFGQLFWKWVNWKRARKLIDPDFSRIKTGKPLVFASIRHDNWKKFSKDIATPQNTEEILDSPNEVMFHAWICDDGIYIGQSKKKVIADYREDIDEIYESDRYLGIISKTYGGDIIFDKWAYRGPDGERLNSKGIKDFIKAKRKGKDVLLSSYMRKV